jgi:hypothetical protein
MVQVNRAGEMTICAFGGRSLREGRKRSRCRVNERDGLFRPLDLKVVKIVGHRYVGKDGAGFILDIPGSIAT